MIVMVCMCVPMYMCGVFICKLCNYKTNYICILKFMVIQRLTWYVDDAR